MAPKQPRSGLVDLSSQFVLVVGSKGISNNHGSTIKSDKSTDLINWESEGYNPWGPNLKLVNNYS